MEDPAPQGVEALRRSLEIEVDVLVAHELATNSPAGRLIWTSVWGDPPATPPMVKRQCPLRGSRTADICAVDTAGRSILVEDKARGGRFEEDQPEDYARVAAQRPSTRTCLVAPKAFIDANSPRAALFTERVSLEELADELDHALSDSRLPFELRTSYEHRCDALRTCAKSPGYEGHPDAEVASFGERYRASAMEVTGGRVVPTDGTMKNTLARIVIFKSWGGRCRLMHKIPQDVIDFQVRGWTRSELETALVALPKDQRQPEGWHVATEAGARRTKETEEPPPVLRYDIHFQTTDPDFDRVEPTVKRALEAMLELRNWFDAAGRYVLEHPSHAVIDRHLATAARQLRRMDADALAANVEQVLARWRA